MKRVVLVLLVVARVGAAQAETFELVTFTPPAGWSRLQVQRGAAFSHGDDGMLVLHPGRPARGNATAEFAALWRELVEPNGAAPPAPQLRTNTGIEIAAGAKQVQFGRTLAWAGLTVIVANGRAQPIVTAASSEQTSRDITAFFQTMTVGAAPSTPSSPPAAPASQPTPAAGGLDVDFDVPAGYTRQDNGPNVWFIAPRDAKTNRFCSFGLAPARASSGDLAADARVAAAQLFGNVRDLGNAQRGTVAAGWSYYEYRFDGVRINPNGPNEDFKAMTMAYAAVDGRVHIAFAYGNLACLLDIDPGFGDLLESVRPRGVTAKPASAPFSIVGSWSVSGTRSISILYSFEASGRYIIAYGTTTTSTAGVPEGYVRETFTQGAPLKGSYTFRNGELSLEGHPQKIRFFEERNYDGSWKPGFALRSANGESLFARVR